LDVTQTPREPGLPHNPLGTNGEGAVNEESRPPDVVALEDVDRMQVAIVGGKAASLGALSQLDGICVPPGFCVTTDAFRRTVAEAPSIGDLPARLASLEADDREAIRALSADARRAVEAVAIPDEVEAAIARGLALLGEDAAYAVRSSATAEDLPTASFAGQHDTYLSVTGQAAILDHVRLCWASLFTERAVTYRLRNGIDHRGVEMAVIVQRMVAAEAAGVLFTADPITGIRSVAVVESVHGLGEALVSGLANPDVFRVRDGEIVAAELQTGRAPALGEAQAVRLAELGRRIEAHFGHPQDIEWCLAGDGFQFVQSRPITTLFPIPAREDDENHVYVSVGHAQMMTDAWKPLGISMWQLTALPPMWEAGGRLFVDVTQRLGSPASRAALLDLMGRGDPLVRDALETVLARDDFVPVLPDGGPAAPPAGDPPPPMPTDPAIVSELISRNQDSLAELKRRIRPLSGPALFDFILEDIQELRRLLFEPANHQAIMAGMEATWWLNDQLQEWLGEKNAADTLTQSAPNNVTSEMGLALLDVADAIRSHASVVAFLEQARDDGFLDELDGIDGGREARDAIQAYLDRYGMRCVGEIDITRTRWSEHPAALIPMILSNVRNFGPGESTRRFELGEREAANKEQEILQRLEALPDGTQKAQETRAMIDRVRTFIGYREYPKYGMVSRYFVYKQALLAEAARLVDDGVLGEQKDIFHLSFAELHDVARTHTVDRELIRRRKEAFRSYQTLTPPRVLTSDGEALSGQYHRDDVPAGALTGLPVSAGTIEGTARVILDMDGADLTVGDILVTTATDPSWTPLFVTVSGLVTEVGGLMTHGAVIAREYGLPAVVGVAGATRLIEDGQRIRVHGTEGYVEILSG
jgi:pyruvate,water dikinase